MINEKPSMVSALKANIALTTLLGGQKIYFMIAPDGVGAPHLTYFEITNFDSTFADDVPIGSEIHMQISVFSPGSTTQIAEEVDKTMKSIGFGRTYAADLYEEDTRLYHKVMRYAKTAEITPV